MTSKPSPCWVTPAGETYDLFSAALDSPHILIAGASGSGKSVLINGLIATMLYRAPCNSAGGAQMVLIDPKRVELSQYKALPHVITHAGGQNPAEWLNALRRALDIMDRRYAEMERAGDRMYKGGDLYVIIDEWANIMFGMDCQTIDQLKKDIEIALNHFKRINLSIYTTIPGGPERDQAAIEAFYNSKYYQDLLSNPKIEIFDEWDGDNIHNVGHDIM